jgi:hypothetical protein
MARLLKDGGDDSRRDGDTVPARFSLRLTASRSDMIRRLSETRYRHNGVKWLNVLGSSAHSGHGCHTFRQADFFAVAS